MLSKASGLLYYLLGLQISQSGAICRYFCQNYATSCKEEFKIHYAAVRVTYDSKLAMRAFPCEKES